MDLVSECSTILPVEIILKIFYEFGGLQHPTSLMIKEYVAQHFNEYRCFNCLYHGSNSQDSCRWDGYDSLAYVDPTWIPRTKNIKNHLLHSYKQNYILVCYKCAHF